MDYLLKLKWYGTSSKFLIAIVSFPFPDKSNGPKSIFAFEKNILGYKTIPWIKKWWVILCLGIVKVKVFSILSGEFLVGLNSNMVSNFFPEKIVPLGVRHFIWLFIVWSVFHSKSYPSEVGLRT